MEQANDLKGYFIVNGQYWQNLKYIGYYQRILKNEEIFRFVNVRPVQNASDNKINRRFSEFDKVDKSPFHKEIEKLTGSDAREKAKNMAIDILHVNNPDEKELSTLSSAVRKSSQKPNVAEAKKILEERLNQPLSNYVTSPVAKRLKSYLWDQLYAHALVPEEMPYNRASVYEGVNIFNYLDVLLRQKDNEKPLTWEEIVSIKPTIPRGIIPTAPSEDNGGDDIYSEQITNELNSLFDKVVSLNSAIGELENKDRIFKAQEMHKVIDIPVVNISNVEALSTKELSSPTLQSFSNTDKTIKEKEISDNNTGTTQLEQKTILVPKKTPWVFGDFGLKNISKTTSELLNARKDRLLELEVAETIAFLQKEKNDMVTEFLEKLPADAIQYVRGTNQFNLLLKQIAIPGYLTEPIKTGFDSLTQPGSASARKLSQPGSASTRGIQPLGIGDLMVIKQELLRYTTGEVAHIENVLKSEFKTRTDIRSREIEEVTIVETEQLEETEKDLQSTERFELQKETEKTIQEQMSLQAGVSITAGYGPVSVTAHADFALNQSTTDSNRTASTFARQVTEQSISRIMKKSREQRMRRTLERYEEKNEHGFDNKNGLGHVIGIYRWVDKYYKAHLINYGRRMMLEFMVPEPSSFYLYLNTNQTPKGVTMKKPEEPIASGHRLRPDDLTKYNYKYYIAQYNVQDAEAYPPEVVYVSAAFAESSGTKENIDYAKTSEKLSIPSGYKCYDVYGQLGWQGYDNYFLECFVAGEKWGSVTANGLEGIVPISIKGFISAFHINLVAACEIKPETRTIWQLKTFAAIMNAYERSLSEYNEQISAAQIQAGVEIQGRNPEFNRKIEQEELKKGVLRLLTNNFAKTRVNGSWRFNEMFDASYSNGQFGYPEFNINEAMIEGKIIQFFEQSFEWNNMTYRFLPYTWARKDKWEDIFSLTDTDPQFTDFLRAGEARVIIPVHPAYNETILHYLATNEIWNGGNPPTLNDPLFISIVDELKSDTQNDLEEDLPACSIDSTYPCVADEWEIKLPTTLVYLQQDSKLPNPAN